VADPKPRNVVVVVVPGDAAHGGNVVRAIEATTGTRAALFLGDPEQADDRAALEEMIDELFSREQSE
jgi:hypothetical protein